MIAVDAMGGDRAPYEIIKGAVAAARMGIPILLCGDLESINSAKKEYSDWDSLPIHIEPSTQIISMDEEPGHAIKRKPDSSLALAMKAVSSGRATAFVSAGNSGAVLVAGIFISGRVAGVHRPAVGLFVPTKNSSVFCLDLGANVDCKTSYFQQFALMGHLYVQLVKRIKKPRVGLLSNGSEPYKGSEEVKKAYDRLLSLPINFVGNIESRDIFDDTIDVLVCDGFVGNVLLKAIQGTSSLLMHWIKNEVAQSSWIRRLFFSINHFIFSRIKKRTDYATTGGALLLGVNHPVVLAHGRSDARAICNAIKFAQKVVEEKRVEQFNEQLTDLLRTEITFSNAVKTRVQSFLKWGQS